MKFFAVAATMLLVLAIPVAASAQAYPPGGNVLVQCSFSNPNITCTASGFEPNSQVQVTATDGPASSGTELESFPANADGSGNVTVNIDACAEHNPISATVTMTGTDADGNQAAGNASVSVNCSGTSTGGGGGTNLPRTGGGFGLLAGASLLGAVVLRRRRRIA